ncbi:hypothetical protein FRB90_001777 [Tulasnella sp. 427]|nr:hypothetical protein FRB90_001777 [Tulasnella sp. 427]
MSTYHRQQEFGDGPVNRVLASTDTFYGYFVDAHVCIAYMVLFAVTGVIHFGQALYHCVWWLAPAFALCALTELIGWGGRYWSSQNAGTLDAFLMQIYCTIIAPSFLAAGLFFVLGVIINRLCPQYASFPPEVFSAVLISCDFITLVVQAVGGAKASISFNRGGDPNQGSKIMVGGIIFQISSTDTFYGYFVDAHVCIAYMVLFALTGAIHLGQAFYHRVWWLAPTFALCAVAELIGWGGRYWSSQDYVKLDAFLMQICCTILAPSFLAAGLFFVLGVIINRLGTQYASFSPKVFSTVFIGCDLVALVVQAVGGASASISFETGGDPEKGAKIMVGGIVFQIFAITLYVATAAEFFFRYHFDKPVKRRGQTEADTEKQPTQTPVAASRNLQSMSFGLILSTILLYVRSVYRTIELLNGWGGPIIHNQGLFNYMDALPIVLALFALNILNPGRLLFGRNAQSLAQVEQPPSRRTGALAVDSPGGDSMTTTPQRSDVKLPK